jgi:hypothetical protein
MNVIDSNILERNAGGKPRHAFPHPALKVNIALGLPMPSLFRFLIVVGVIGAIGYGAIFALANFVQPTPREMSVTIHPDKFLKK